MLCHSNKKGKTVKSALRNCFPILTDDAYLMAQTALILSILASEHFLQSQWPLPHLNKEKETPSLCVMHKGHEDVSLE